MATINGTIGDDILEGTDEFDILHGFEGNDTLYGGEGNDTLDGGTGSDVLYGGNGYDLYIVDNADDQIIEITDPNNSTIDIVESLVSWTLGDSLEYLILKGNAPLDGTGNALDNVISGNDADNSLFGGEGDDLLMGKGGNDSLYGGEGNDLLSGGDGDNYLDGGTGSDSFNGGAGNDTYIVDDVGDQIQEIAIVGDLGYDTVRSSVTWALGYNLDQLVLTGEAAINGTGNELNNRIVGNNASNSISGFNGDDTLIGKGGNDSLNGDIGNDTLIGGRGSDILTGGAGADRFIRKYSTTAIDTIIDFQVGVDLLAFSASGFGGELAEGAVLDETQFTIGSAAADSSDRFIYDSATGGLFFDADGIGGDAQVQIFTLSTDLAMTNADIFIFA